MAGDWQDMKGALRSFSSLAFSGAVITLLTMQAANAQNGTSLDTEDPRRQENTSKVAAEIEVANPSAPGQDEALIHDAYQPQGIEAGSFLIFPDLSVGEAYNSNIYATETDVRSDFITRLKPSFVARSRYDRHMLNFTGEVEQLIYKEYSDDNQLNAKLGSNGRLDIGSSSELTALLSGIRAHEDRGSPDATNGREPTAYNTVEAQLGGKTTAGRWVYALNGLHRTTIFEDGETDAGTPIDNGQRDRSLYEVTGRVAYEMFPGYFAVGQLSSNWREYHESVNAGGFDRSSSGYAGQVGIGVDLSRLVRGDFLVGYFDQDYNDPGLQDPSGLSIQSILNWTPTRSTLVVGSLRRDVAETTDTTASSIVRTTGSVLVRHELRRNIVVSASGRVSYDEYEGVDAETTSYDTRASVTYAFNPNLYTSADVAYVQREVDGPISNPYDQVVTSIRIGLRM